MRGCRVGVLPEVPPAARKAMAGAAAAAAGAPVGGSGAGSSAAAGLDVDEADAAKRPVIRAKGDQRHGVVVEGGAAAALHDCVIAGAHLWELQESDFGGLSSDGVGVYGSGSRVLASGFFAEDGAQMDIGPPPPQRKAGGRVAGGAAGAAGLAAAAAAEAAAQGAEGQEQPWHAIADGCEECGFLADDAKLVMRPGARALARACEEAGFKAGCDGVLDASKAGLCLAQYGDVGYGFAVERARAKLLLGCGHCRAEGDPKRAKQTDMGSVIRGELKIVDVA
ncbi:hypothetical protein HXX76_015983 [Chlamydomonas incerta]|uniref:Uncharacterized protein n=1 Tax=Chlamydomonas incerta TaxID=51695 RepID=A0A835VP42_CHLIN|nr:hypothetical protein HXX76_015983 [Chlamydomonas incerta]|eukprot:KAG2422515.1 hypothetical protein HXX76_015983 [Chlamydomonas incerta]